MKFLFVIMTLFISMLPLWAQNALEIRTCDGQIKHYPVSSIQEIQFIHLSRENYNWKLGGINAETGNIYSRTDRVYSDLIPVDSGDVIKNNRYLYVVVYYNNDSTWNRSDYSTNGFRNRDFLIEKKGLIRLLVAKPDFTSYAEPTCDVWIQKGGYESQPSMADKYPELFPKDKFGLQAHRGLCNEFPENTLLSFQEAAKERIYKGMETDAQMTKDGVLVCMHDNTLTRTTTAEGKVASYCYSDLDTIFIDGGYGWNEKWTKQLKIPTFESYLDVCKANGLVPYVELKLLTYPGIKKVVDMIHSKGYKDGEYVLTSFQKEYLLYASTLCDAPLEFMKDTFSEEEILQNAHLKNIILRPNSKKITDGFIQKCREMNILVECYGIPVGNSELVQKLKGWHVAGGTCNSWKGLGITENYR